MIALEASYFVFVVLAGFGMGSLGLLMIGHMMDEHWLAPVRSEAEAAALTVPLLLLAGIPLALGLDGLFPWLAERSSLPAPHAAFLRPGFFILRAFCYLAICGGLALWLTRTRHLRRASGFGLALLAPVITLAAYDWVLSREPQWWSSLFGFSFALSQLLAALAAAILITLLRFEHSSLKRMLSLERALLTLALLTLWAWFAQFLIVWLSNLPHEAAWYVRRSEPSDLVLLGIAVFSVVAAVVVLVPTGVGRGAMIVGSALILLQHGAHMLWIMQPDRDFSLLDLGLAATTSILWIALFSKILRSRPSFSEEMSGEP